MGKRAWEGVSQIVAMTRVSKDGKLSLKKAVREQIGLQKGQTLYLDVQDEVLLTTEAGQGHEIPVDGRNRAALPGGSFGFPLASTIGSERKTRTSTGAGNCCSGKHNDPRSKSGARVGWIGKTALVFRSEPAGLSRELPAFSLVFDGKEGCCRSCRTRASRSGWSFHRR